MSLPTRFTRQRARGFASRLPTVGATAFARLTSVGVAFLALIVVTGGAVRLTGSGLGCPTWPECGGGSFVTRPRYSYWGWIEFGNRMVTVGVGILMLVIPLVALRLRDRRRDLVTLSFGLWAGFAGQVVLGGLTVLSKLNPAFVAAHFLLSMVLLVDVVALDRRARSAARAAGPGGADAGTAVVPGTASAAVAGVGPVRAPVAAELRWLGRALAVVCGATLVLGTVVTGTGPHSGDGREAHRFGFDIRTVAQLHADAAMLLVGLVAAAVLAVRVAGAPAEARRAVTALLCLVIAQCAIGFTQYFTGVPVGLVEIHIAGATATWIASVWLWLALTERPAPPRPAPVIPHPDRAPAAEPLLVPNR
jgi:heme a synthase